MDALEVALAAIEPWRGAEDFTVRTDPVRGLDSVTIYGPDPEWRIHVASGTLDGIPSSYTWSLDERVAWDPEGPTATVWRWVYTDGAGSARRATDEVRYLANVYLRPMAAGHTHGGEL